MESNAGSSVRGVASLRWSGIACHSCIHSTLDAASPWHQVGRETIAFESLVSQKATNNNKMNEITQGSTPNKMQKTQNATLLSCVTKTPRGK